MLKVWNQNAFQVKAILSGTRQRNKREGAGMSSSYSLHGFFTDPITMFTHKNEYLLFPLLPGFAAGGACHCYYSWRCLPEVEWSWCNSHSWHCCPRRAKKCHENRPMFGFVFLKHKSSQVYLLALKDGLSHFRNANIVKWMVLCPFHTLSEKFCPWALRNGFFRLSPWLGSEMG